MGPSMIVLRTARRRPRLFTGKLRPADFSPTRFEQRDRDCGEHHRHGDAHKREDKCAGRILHPSDEIGQQES